MLDCTEFPCFLIIHRAILHEAASRCPPLIPFAEVAPDVAALREEVGQGWEDWVPFDTENLAEPNGPLSSAAHMRFPARIRQLTERLAKWEVRRRGTGMVVELAPDCDEMKKAISDMQTSSNACGALQTYWGCDAESDSAISVNEYRDHVERAQKAVDEALETCPELVSRGTYLDCSRLPCILVSDGSRIQDPRSQVEVFCSLGRTNNQYRTRVSTRGTVLHNVLWSEIDPGLEPILRDRWAAEADTRFEEVDAEWFGRFPEKDLDALYPRNDDSR